MSAQVLDILIHFSPLGTFVGAFIAVTALFIKLFQDEKDLRRKQAEVARLVYNDLHQDEYSMAALIMLDYQGWRHNTKDFKDITIYYDDVKTALTVKHETNRPDKELLVRRAFDTMFAKLENIVALARRDIGLVRWSDFSTLFAYYVYLMRQDRYSGLLIEYARTYGSTMIVELISRDDLYPLKLPDDLPDEARSIGQSPVQPASSPESA
ncbi:MAG: hypothetical protein JWM87_1084 [Candidatus Eremiobacteraeota bacterium]|nr:hypothetical protein [Candidatus Eremiobacteraeota bacterium]